MSVGGFCPVVIECEILNSSDQISVAFVPPKGWCKIENSYTLSNNRKFDVFNLREEKESNHTNRNPPNQFNFNAQSDPELKFSETLHNCLSKYSQQYKLNKQYELQSKLKLLAELQMAPKTVSTMLSRTRPNVSCVGKFLNPNLVKNIHKF